jgi:hypothetical protein
MLSEVLLPILLALWRPDRKAGNGVLIEGSPSRAMHQAIVRLVHCQFSCAGDIACHARVGNAGLQGLEGAENATSSDRALPFDLHRSVQSAGPILAPCLAL